MRPIFYFLMTNLAVLVMMSIVVSVASALLGVRFDQGGLVTMFVMAAVMGSAGSLISLYMSKSMALRSVGGQIIEQPRNEGEAFIFSTVERISAEWGFKTPQIAIYDSPEPNAFATGASKNNSLVAVSTGLLRGMTRDEVEGVLGHELAHVGNGDMVTMALIQGVLNTFVIFLSNVIASLVASYLNRDQYDENGQPQQGGMANMMVYHMVATALNMCFGALASIISMYFSRVREYRADAGSAKHVGAAKMIAALKRLQAMQSGHSDVPRELSVMAISSPEQDGLMSTHPTLNNRIHRLQNEFGR